MIVTDEKLLRVKCEDVKPEEVAELKLKLEQELIASAMKEMPGIGLAAPQIGIPKRMAIVRCGSQSIDLVNCKIESGYNKALFDGEGCLSYPGRYEKTFRYQEIYVTNNFVEPHSFTATGLVAVVVQHELDHLDGILLPDVALAKPKQKVKLRPNDKCSCGSGKKYKKCCGLR